MNLTPQFIRGTVFLAVTVLGVGWFIAWSVKHAEDPARMVFKWILTALVLAGMAWKVAPMVGEGGYGAAFGGIPLTAACGLVLAIIWRHDLAEIVARPFGSLYDGGSQPPIPHPAYSTAQSRQKQGKYLEAIAEIRKQLDRFPTDVEGYLLLAQIQAEDLKDLPAAELTIQRFCAQPGHAPKNIAFALYSLADWHLKIGQDLEGARRALEKIVEMFPESEFALGAAQRIAHLASKDMLLAPNERRKFAVLEGVQNLGLLKDQEHLKPIGTDPAQAAHEYVKHLEQHPLDTDAREKLALIYAGHYQRLDMAADQLEQMIQQPNQPGRLVVHWLNLLADLQVRAGVDYATVKQTLERIIDREPNLAGAEIARNRLARLRLELKANQTKESVKMGSYEQNIGLKHGPPRRMYGWEEQSSSPAADLPSRSAPPPKHPMPTDHKIA
ncbi:MAG: Outer rane lipoprotein [Verrucomicrobiota bacterium]